MPVGEYRRENGEKATTFEEMRFIDSFRFMGMGLEKLLSFLPKDAFEILDTHFASNHSKADIKLLHQKVFYPYAYADKLEKFNEPDLPPIEKWSDALQGGDTSINDENFRHTKNVFDIFGYQNFGAYHDLYLTTDTLLLACVFEHLEKFAIPPMHWIARNITLIPI